MLRLLYGWLWFDVENVKNTTERLHNRNSCKLWFDVENVKNTTLFPKGYLGKGCGLM